MISLNLQQIDDLKVCFKGIVKHCYVQKLHYDVKD